MHASSDTLTCHLVTNTEEDIGKVGSGKLGWKNLSFRLRPPNHDTGFSALHVSCPEIPLRPQSLQTDYPENNLL